VIKSGFAEKKGKIKWAPRRLMLYRGELHCYRVEEKDIGAGANMYPLNLIQLTLVTVAIAEKNILRLITHQRKFEFRFETEVRSIPCFFSVGFGLNLSLFLSSPLNSGGTK